MGPPDIDVAVIGAGPAGIAAAHGLMSAGLRVMMIDPGTPPAARIESLPENGEALAESIGFAPALSRASLGRATTMRNAMMSESCSKAMFLRCILRQIE